MFFGVLKADSEGFAQTSLYQELLTYIRNILCGNLFEYSASDGDTFNTQSFPAFFLLFILLIFLCRFGVLSQRFHCIF